MAWCPSCATSVRAPAPQLLGEVPLIAAGRLEGVWQNAIHSYKYVGRPQLAAVLAEALRTRCQRAAVRLTGLTFVPLHPARQRSRGFNQAERLARELARALAVPIVCGLERVRNTPPQVGLTQVERLANVAGAFRWVGPLPHGLGLVDDVCTTGATLRAAEAAIKAAGGSVSAFLVLASPQTLPRAAVAFSG